MNAAFAELFRSEPTAVLDPALVVATEWRAERKRFNEAAAETLVSALQ
jgi:hypothetical protein